MRRLVTGGHAGPAGSQQPEPGWSHGCTGWWSPCRRWSGAKRLPLWVCEAMPLGGSCLRSRLMRSPYVGFAPLSWQRRAARRLGRTSSVLPLRGNPPSPSGEGLESENPRAEARGRGGHSAGLNCLGFIRGDSFSAFMRHWVISRIATASTRMELARTGWRWLS